jgi:hypothetical protein
MSMNLSEWLLTDIEDAIGRLTNQALTPVPLLRRGERPGGGNSITWTSLHIARHAQLALSALDGTAIDTPVTGGDGLDESEAEWAAGLDAARVEAYLFTVLEAVRGYVASLDPDALDAVPNAERALAEAGVPRERYAWLYAQWSGQPTAFFLRWPLLGHVRHHTGELTATRNRLGLSPHG